MSDSIDIAAPASAPVSAWNLQWIARSPTLGPLILQQEHGSYPALIALDPPRALWSWPHGATVRDGQPGRSRVDVRDLVSRSVVRSHVLDASVKALTFLEPIP